MSKGTDRQGACDRAGARCIQLAKRRCPGKLIGEEVEREKGREYGSGDDGLLLDADGADGCGEKRCRLGLGRFCLQGLGTEVFNLGATLDDHHGKEGARELACGQGDVPGYYPYLRPFNKTGHDCTLLVYPILRRSVSIFKCLNPAL